MLIEVKGKPIPQPRQRHNRFGRNYIPKDHPVWRWKAAVTFAWLQLYGLPYRIPFAKGDLSLRLTFRGAHGSSDSDNLAKSVMDCLQGLAYSNDRQIKRLEVIREKGEPGATIEVEAL